MVQRGEMPVECESTPRPGSHAMTAGVSTEKASTDQFAFLLIPGFSLLGLSAGIEALRAANNVSRAALYSWGLVSETPGPVVSSSGLCMQAEGLDSAEGASLVAVCGGNRSHDYDSPRLYRWLRGLAKRGATVGALSDGSYIVASAGLFEGVRSTIHWHCLDSYRDRFPNLDIRASTFELDHNRFSCAGGTSALDLMLTIIQHRHGQDLAMAVAENFIHDHIREAGSTQLSAYILLRRRSRKLAEAARLMEQNVEQPLTINEMGRQLRLSPRQLDRIFRTHLQTSPGSFYRKLRVDRARHLIVQTGLSIAQIAAATGFSSSAHLARCFRQCYGTSPRAFRNSIRFQ